MYEENILIPEKKVKELNYNKAKIEEKCNVKLDIRSDGDVIISGKDVLDCDLTKKIVKAIARGFDVKDAMKLINEEYSLELVDITDFKKITRTSRKLMRARVIGTDGKVKKTIEMMTKTHISVSGKTVAIIGKIENAFLARRAVEIILSGHKQTSAYKFLRESLEASKENSS